MNEINDEIKLTISLMQSDIYEGALNELQLHLLKLLEIKRNEIQERLAECCFVEVTHDQDPHKIFLDVFDQGSDEDKQLTTEELKGGAWWCDDASEECRLALFENGVHAVAGTWNDNTQPLFIYKLGHEAHVHRAHIRISKARLKQIHRIGNDFYWSNRK